MVKNDHFGPILSAEILKTGVFRKQGDPGMSWRARITQNILKIPGYFRVFAKKNPTFEFGQSAQIEDKFTLIDPFLALYIAVLNSKLQKMAFLSMHVWICPHTS